MMPRPAHLAPYSARPRYEFRFVTPPVFDDIAYDTDILTHNTGMSGAKAVVMAAIWII